MHKRITQALYRETLRTLYLLHGDETDTIIVTNDRDQPTSVTTFQGHNVARSEYTHAHFRPGVVKRFWLDLDLLPADSFGPNVHVKS